MHKLTSLLFCSLALLMLAACKPEMEFVNSSLQPGDSQATLSQGNLSVTFPSGAGTASVNLEANRKWTASFVNDRAKDWCSLSAESGKRGTAKIVISVKENADYDERSASIRFTCGDVVRTIVVTQKQKDALLLSSKRQDVEQEGGRIEITFQTNVPVNCVVSQSWIKPEGPILDTKGLTSSSLSFLVDANEDVEKREATITISSAVGKEKEVVKVYQEGAAPTIIVSCNPVEVSSAGGIFAVEVRSNVDVTSIDYPQDCDWIKEIVTKAMSTNTYYFEAQKNEAYDPREAVFTFRNKEFGLEETLTVRQAQKDVILCSDGDNLQFDFLAGTFSITTQFNVDYTVRSSVSWLKHLDTKALKTQAETFSLERNEGYDARTAELTFTSEGHPDATLTLQVTQAGKDPMLDVTVPGVYGLNGDDYVRGADGWNQTACRVDADGSIQYHMLNAARLTAISVTGLSTDSEVGDVCTLQVSVFNKANVSLSADFPATLLDVKDGMYWLRTLPDTYYIIKR